MSRTPDRTETTDWQPIETAPKDCSIIEIRYLGDDGEWWGYSCRRSPDGVFRCLEGNPLYRTPDEWREEVLNDSPESAWLQICPGRFHPPDYLPRPMVVRIARIGLAGPFLQASCAMTEQTQTTAPLTDRERHLAILLSNARLALWREWVEAGSEAAKAAHDATDPTGVP